MTNTYNTTLYVGVTSDLYSRVFEHREKKYPTSFTSRYNLNKLVYYKSFSSIEEAIDMEKKLKGLSRAKKESIIKEKNPKWDDIFSEIKDW